MKKLSLIVLLLNLTLFSMSAQDIEVKGVVVSGYNNEPLPGVNIVMKDNTSVGTISNMDGNFNLSVPANAILTVSYIGFRTQEVALHGQSF